MSFALIQLEELMHSLGPSSSWVDSLVQEASDSWALQTSDGLSIAMTFNPETSRLFLSTLLGQPEEKHQSAIYATMLCMNLLYAEDHSLRVALTGPSGDLMLISEVSLTDWTIASLQYCILHFHQHARNLMEEIHALEDSEITPEISERDFLRA